MVTQESPADVAAERLRTRRDRVVAQWLKRVQQQLEAARSTNPPELVDDIPEVLDRVAEALASPDPERELEPAAAWMGVEHGQQRASLTAYSLEQVIIELRLLHDTLLDVLDEGGPIDRRSRDVITHATLVSIRNAAGEFSRVRGAATELRETYRDQLIATLAHDLRSPLAAALMGASLILHSPGNTEKVPVWATKISTALTRVDHMICDLLDASLIHHGGVLALEFEHCDAKPIVEQLFEELKARHGDRFRLEVEGSTEGFWSADGLRRVFDNLMSNSIKYGDSSAPITVRLKRVEDRLLAGVHNVGTMIPIEEQENVFRAYHRAPTAQLSGQPGWGIGLTLVKGIVEAHGGVVKAESYPTEGTTFTIDLPVDSAAATRALNLRATSTQT